ncbi:MAG: hypothetical protein U9O94_11785 [Nanoarchaeota archaeon]|nr:hypothetical protein [Nanoarchaeota archaeon]
MASIDWCLKVNKGIRLIEPSELKCRDYISRAEDDIKSMQTAQGHWKIITSYYACYDVLYALLMKFGIKSEIHDCSIALMNLFSFKKEDIEFLEELKEDRIKVQYYLENITLKDENKVKLFVLSVKEIISKSQKIDIENLRNLLMEKISNLSKGDKK